jgi:hypothetical protein
VRRPITGGILLLAVLLTAAPPASAGITWTDPVVLDGAGGPHGRVNENIGQDTAAVRYGGVTHLFYSAGLGARAVLRQATFGHPTVFATLDGKGGPAGQTTSGVGSDVSAAVFGGSLHVFYLETRAGDLRHAWFNGSRWRFRTLDGASTVGGRIVADVGDRSVVTVYGGRLEVVYLDDTNLDVRRASYDGTRWSFSTVDGDSTGDGHTDHEVGYNLATGVWGNDLHVLYYEADPAYDDANGHQRGWVREARFDGGSWTYSRLFEVDVIIPGKTLALGVVADDRILLAYTTLAGSDADLRRRTSDGVDWSDSEILSQDPYGDMAGRALFAIADGIPTLAFCDRGVGCAGYLTWSHGAVTSQGAYAGDPGSALVVRGVLRIYWGRGDPSGCCDSLLLRTSRP